MKKYLISPPNLQFLIGDIDATGIPFHGENLRVTNSGTIISVPCRYHDEGDTELTIALRDEEKPARSPQFDGTLPTPSGRVLFSTVMGEELLTLPAKSSATRIRVWTDGLSLPEKITIMIGG